MTRLWKTGLSLDLSKSFDLNSLRYAMMAKDTYICLQLSYIKKINSIIYPSKFATICDYQLAVCPVLGSVSALRVNVRRAPTSNPTMTAALSDYNRTGSCNPALAVVRHAPAAAAPVASLPGRVDSSSRGSVICFSGVSCCSEYRSRVMSLAASPIVARLLPAVSCLLAYCCRA